MKTAQNLTFFIRQLRPTTRHAHTSIFRHTQLPYENTSTSRTLHTHLSKPKSITPLSRTQQSPLKSPYIPKALRRSESTNTNPPGFSFSPQNSQNNTESIPSPPEASPPSTANPNSLIEPSDPQSQDPQRPRPIYKLVFTCKPCGHRSAHEITKHGYHAGTVLITCPECVNRHVISDHLRIFSDLSLTIEDLMRDKGELVKKGSITETGDIEFWDQASEEVRRTPKMVKDLLLRDLVGEEANKMEYDEWKARDVLLKRRGVHPGKEEEGGASG